MWFILYDLLVRQYNFLNFTANVKKVLQIYVISYYLCSVIEIYTYILCVMHYIFRIFNTKYHHFTKKELTKVF